MRSTGPNLATSRIRTIRLLRSARDWAWTPACSRGLTARAARHISNPARYVGGQPSCCSRDIDDGIVVNVPQRMLFVLSSGNLIVAYPVAVGRPGWRTPRGDFTVEEKRKNPVWRVPPSIQAEMAREGKRVRTTVLPGADNPLGKYWIGLSIPGIGIHATTAPSSIYQCRTHGCIRLHPDDAAALFSIVEIGTPGKIVYEPLLMAHLPDGRTLVEANPDIYRLQAEDPIVDLKGLAESRDFGNMVDWQRVARFSNIGKGWPAK